jgi:hypothetical protein
MADSTVDGNTYVVESEFNERDHTTEYTVLRQRPDSRVAEEVGTYPFRHQARDVADVLNKWRMVEL